MFSYFVHFFLSVMNECVPPGGKTMYCFSVFSCTLDTIKSKAASVTPRTSVWVWTVFKKCVTTVRTRGGSGPDVSKGQYVSIVDL